MKGTLPTVDTLRGYAPQVVTLCNFGSLSASDIALLEFYPYDATL